MVLHISDFKSVNFSLFILEFFNEPYYVATEVRIVPGISHFYFGCNCHIASTQSRYVVLFLLQLYQKLACNNALQKSQNQLCWKCYYIACESATKIKRPSLFVLAVLDLVKFTSIYCCNDCIVGSPSSSRLRRTPTIAFYVLISFCFNSSVV